LFFILPSKKKTEKKAPEMIKKSIQLKAKEKTPVKISKLKPLKLNIIIY